MIDTELEVTWYCMSQMISVKMTSVTLGLGKDEHRPCRIKGSSCNESTGGC